MGCERLGGLAGRSRPDISGQQSPTTRHPGRIPSFTTRQLGTARSRLHARCLGIVHNATSQVETIVHISTLWMTRRENSLSKQGDKPGARGIAVPQGLPTPTTAHPNHPNADYRKSLPPDAANRRLSAFPRHFETVVGAARHASKWAIVSDSTHEAGLPETNPDGAGAVDAFPAGF